MSWIQDAGHGGSDPGAVAKGNIEKVYTLEAALYVDKRLADHGIASDVTRASDVTLDEDPRVAKVRKYKKGNSHHFNAGGGSGVEVIVSQYSDQKFAKLVIDEFKKAGYPVRPRAIFTKKLSGGKDYYYMHRRTDNCHVNIIEYDFVDGPQADKIKDKAYREGMYECVVRATCRYDGVTYKAPGEKVVTPKPDVAGVTSKPKANLKVDGSFGPLTITALQRYFGTWADGLLSKPSMVVKALQKWVGVKQDGYLGPITIKALQRKMGTPEDGKISRPSLVIKELQRRLNKGHLG